LIAGGARAYIVYEPARGFKGDAETQRETALIRITTSIRKKAACLRSEVGAGLDRATGVGEGPVSATYYRYESALATNRFRHEAGLLPPLQKLAIQNVVVEAAPKGPGLKQVMACFALEGQELCGADWGGEGGRLQDLRRRRFFIQDPRRIV